MARRCAAVFRLGQPGLVGKVFTGAVTSDGEDGTRAREGRVVRWCADHGEHHLRRCLAMAAVVETVTATLPKLEWND